MTQVQSTIREGLRAGVDLVAIIALVALVNLVVFLPGVDGTVVRVVLGSVFVLFVPGYVLLAALFPEAGRSPTDTDRSGLTGDSVSLFDKPREQRTIDGLERAALAFALSIALVPLLMLGLLLAGFPFAMVPITATLTAWTAVLVPVAAIRRWQLPPRQRFRVPVWQWLGAREQLTASADSRFDAALNVGVVAVIVLALATSAFAVAAPPEGERYTEFYVSTADGDGNLSFSNYPDTLRPGDTESMHVGIENYEGESVDYSVVVQLQRVEGSANDTAVTDRVAVDRFSTTLGPSETRQVNRSLTVANRLTGDNLRLQFLLYEGSVPDNPTAENAYRTVHLWVDVEGGTERSPR